jgi:hypothetical protein
VTEAVQWKTEVDYTPHAAKHAERCALCRYFISRYGRCKRVAGTISAYGWCKLWEAKT